ncbi:hypothetical protein Q2941_32460 [Bradyrhizobium sp. UFLA05-153]
MHRPSTPKWYDAQELHREHQRKMQEMQELIETSARMRSQPARREAARLLSPTQIDEARAYYEHRLDEDLRRWRSQQAAAKRITVEFLKLPERSWQTVEDEVVIPVLDRRGLRRKK